MGGQAFGNIGIVYATNRAGRAVTVVSAPINIAVRCIYLTAGARNSVGLELEPCELIIIVLDDVL